MDISKFSEEELIELRSQINDILEPNLAKDPKFDELMELYAHRTGLTCNAMLPCVIHVYFDEDELSASAQVAQDYKLDALIAICPEIKSVGLSLTKIRSDYKKLMRKFCKKYKMTEQAVEYKLWVERPNYID